MIENQKNILLVEDDENILLSIGLQLEMYNFNICYARNGNEALQKLEEEKIVLVISDIMMPGLDGIQFCKKLRQIEKFKFLPILLITGSIDTNTKYNAFNSGTDDFITKPFDPFELLLRIKSLLRRNEVIKEKDQNKKLFENNSKFIINEKEVIFTNSEFQIFKYLFYNDDHYIDSDELLQKVLDYPKGIGNPEIIRTHIKKIRNKIEKDPHKPDILKTHLKKGYFIDKSQMNLET